MSTINNLSIKVHNESQKKKQCRLLAPFYVKSTSHIKIACRKMVSDSDTKV
jgi:hypothetical protein